MLILNFSHPLTPEQLQDISSVCHCDIARVIDIPVQMDHQEPFAEQMARLLDGLDISAEQWQAGGILVNLPGLSSAACVLITLIHGLSGHFPAIIRLKPVQNSMPVAFELAEIVNLQSVRDDARTRR